MKHGLVYFLLLLAGLTLTGAQQLPSFRFDDPLLQDPDQLPGPMPQKIRLSQAFDLLENSFSSPVKKEAVVGPSANTNTLGEVPDSSWFQNRIGKRALSLAELRRGPDRSAGPLLPWIILGVKTQGVAPGFTIEDNRGELYFIKFDPRQLPQLTTSTEVIATKFFHAIGYNVPENYLVWIQRKDLQIGSGMGHCGQLCEVADHKHEAPVFVDEEGKQRVLTDRHVDNIFKRFYRDPDGRTPVVASLRIEGIPLGPFHYYGTRSDDLNDIFPHQDRRELRGLRVFSAWLNHDDSRSINSLDMFVGEKDRGYVKHYLLDFGSALGSGSVKIQSRRGGNEYIYEPSSVVKAGLTLGIWDRGWRHVDYPDYPAIGRFESKFFQPEKWKPEYPNAAFSRMQPEDAFWATRILMEFNSEAIRAVVETGQLPDPGGENYLINVLAERRDKIVRYYLGVVNPLSDFEVNGGALRFRDLGVEAGLAAPHDYAFRWFRFDNDNGTLDPIGSEETSSARRVDLPAEKSHFLMLRIWSPNSEQPAWQTPVEVFLRDGSVVGIER